MRRTIVLAGRTIHAKMPPIEGHTGCVVCIVAIENRRSPVFEHGASSAALGPQVDWDRRRFLCHPGVRS
ncbi:MAG: hypothetical protein Q7R41_10815 [Phycisphaerales bacterium]|nr:hypothetical protein [Phycisphaerales bacterium]